MRIVADFPSVEFLDSADSASLTEWWDTLGDAWVRVNVVTDALGHVTGVSGTSAELTGGADRAILTALRTVADCVVLGGETVRREPDSVPRSRPVIIVSKSASIPLEVVRRARAGMMVLHGPDAEAPPGTTGVTLPRFTGSSILKAVRSLGFSRIVCEGGPRLAAALLKSGEVTEWCQTISPHIGDVSGPTITEPSGVISSVAHDDAGFRYLRRRLNGAPQS